MQVTAKDHEQLSGVVTVKSDPVDMSDLPALTATMVVHSIDGTSPDLEIGLETSDNLEDWVSFGSSVSRSTAGVSLAAARASSTHYGRYVRASIALTGTDPVVVYSLILNTFPSR